jgi:GntR family histidine utilization transcriptional repressor
LNQISINSWQGVQEEVLRRIRNRVWKPGAQIPNEMDLAKEFECSRSTVNRALRELAENGFLERKRKSGTRVARHPVAKAVLDIQIVRHEVEDRGSVYSYGMLGREIKMPPNGVTFALEQSRGEEMLHIVALHMADGAPYALEDRWISLSTVPEARNVDFTIHSANEWLLENISYDRAALTIYAGSANKSQQEHLNIPHSSPLMHLERQTWIANKAVTHVILSHMPGHRIVRSITN